MALPNRIVKITKGYALVFLLGLALVTIADESNYKEKLKLEKIQSRMVNVNKEIEKSKDKVSVLQAELMENELMTNNISMQLENIQYKILKKKEALKKLNIKKENRQKILNKEKEILISQIRSIYKIGKYNYFKILLSQKNPSQINRAIAYYDYDNYARSKRIKKLGRTLKDIEEIESIISGQTTKLELLKNKHEFKLKKFNKYRDNRLNFIKDINKYIKQQGIELLLLKENEHKLEALLNNLKTIQLDKFDSTKKEISFSSKKGKLIWPIDGRLLKKYGAEKKITGIKWKGVLIEAKEDSQVSAVSEGKIVFADWFRNFGLLIIIEHQNNFLSLYGHNKKLLKTTGDFVKTGENIATVGDSGGQENTALYFEIREGKKTLDPSKWCKK